MEVRTGYKQTDLGVIPKDWNCRKIDEFNPFVTSGSRGWGGYYSKYGAPFVRITNMSRSTIALSLGDLKNVSLPPEASEGKRTQLKTGDLLVSITADIGIISYVSDTLQKPAYINQHIALVRFDQQDVNSLFLSYYLSQGQTQRWFRSITDQGAKAGINLAIIRKINIALPPTLEEQKIIAGALLDVNELILSLETLITKKRNIKQGAMQELLSPNEGWMQKKLGNVASLKARIGWQGLTTAEYLDVGNYCLVTGTDFKDGFIDWEHCHFVVKNRYDQDPNIQLKENDVLVTKDGTIGKIALIDQLTLPATLNSGVFVIRPVNKAFDPRFFFYLLNSSIFANFLSQLSAGSTINHLYQKDFVDFVFHIPKSETEQKAIATILFDMDAEITALETKLTKTRQIKLGMMAELLTGQIRLVTSQSIEKEVAVPEKPSQNWAFKEAVIIASLTDQFGSAKFPLGRKRCTKLTYLMHRKAKLNTDGYLKKAAGPYNPNVRYSGPETLAQKKKYVCSHKSGKFTGFISSDNIEEAKSYFTKWYGTGMSNWLDQFRYQKNDDLEVLTTVDMAMVEVCKSGETPTLETVKHYIANEPEWVAKLEREAFCDSNIRNAIQTCADLFGDFVGTKA